MENERENLRAGRHVKKQFGFWLCKIFISKFQLPRICPE